ncbi:hypothetical protein WA026_007710 [Henosepilachna vigintioctopunctata]
MLDYLSHTYPNSITDRSNGDIACDSYHKIDEDIEMLKHLGVNFYRFSLSWSRILPTGSIEGGVNLAGVKYYSDMLDKLKAAKIDAMVTLVHFDVPIGFIKEKMFRTEKLNQMFVDYARLAFNLFGDRVKYWLTINEPAGFSKDEMRTFYTDRGRDVYLTAHNIIKCHAAIYHLYNKEFREQQGGKLSIALNTDWYEPASDSKEDIEAAERALMFEFGWIAHPLIYGDYPEIMKKAIASSPSPLRLPVFTYEEKETIKDTVDFIALNHYSSFLTTNDPNKDVDRTFDKDIGILKTLDPSWETTILDWLHVAPSGMRKVLNWINKTYGNKPILITENGYVEGGTLKDDRRINYLQTYLSSVLDAIYIDNINVIGYSTWSLMDNWELYSGYSAKFGLYYVNFTSPNRERIAKDSVGFYKNVLESRHLVNNRNAGNHV